MVSSQKLRLKWSAQVQVYGVTLVCNQTKRFESKTLQTAIKKIAVLIVFIAKLSKKYLIESEINSLNMY